MTNQGNESTFVCNFFGPATPLPQGTHGGPGWTSLISNRENRGVTESDTAGASPLTTASARSLLLTVMGEFAYPRDEAIWTTALVRVLGGLGVEGHAARQAISRSAGSGWIERERIGRTARWRLTRSGKKIIEDGLHRATAFLDRSEPW